MNNTNSNSIIVVAKIMIITVFLRLREIRENLEKLFTQEEPGELREKFGFCLISGKTHGKFLSGLRKSLGDAF